MIKQVIILLIGSWLFLACSLQNEPTSKGGSGIDIPNGLNARVIQTNGDPVPNARGIVIRQDNWLSRVSSGLSPELDTIQADSLGVFHVEWIDDKPRKIQLIENGLCAFIDFDTLVTEIIMDTCASVNSTWNLNNQGGDSLQVFLMGTALVASTDQNNQFSFANVPVMSVPLVGKTVQGELVLLNTVQVTSASSDTFPEQQAKLDRLVFEDFNDSTNFPLSKKWLVRSTWYSQAAACADCIAEIFPSTQLGEKIPSAITDSGAYEGNSILFKYLLVRADTGAIPFALTGYFFRDPINFSKLDSIVFYYQADVRIQFNILPGYAAPYQGYRTWFDASPNVWTRAVVRPQDLTPDEGYALPLGLAYRMKFDFSNPAGSYLFLDQIEIYGDIISILSGSEN